MELLGGIFPTPQLKKTLAGWWLADGSPCFFPWWVNALYILTASAESPCSGHLTLWTELNLAASGSKSAHEYLVNAAITVHYCLQLSIHSALEQPGAEDDIYSSSLSLTHRSSQVSHLPVFTADRLQQPSDCEWRVSTSNLWTCTKLWLGKGSRNWLPWQLRWRCPWVKRLTSHCFSGAAHWPATENNDYTLQLSDGSAECCSLIKMNVILQPDFAKWRF